MSQENEDDELVDAEKIEHTLLKAIQQWSAVN